MGARAPGRLQKFCGETREVSQCPKALILRTCFGATDVVLFQNRVQALHSFPASERNLGNEIEAAAY